MDESPTLQDSVVAGDLHVGDVQHNTTNIDQSTTIDKSTKIDLPSLDNVSQKMDYFHSQDRNAFIHCITWHFKT